MAIATGVFKQLRYKKQTVLGTPPGATGGQLLRRVTSDLNLTKETFQSNEIRSDFQVADFRHGSRTVSGTINGELSLGTYQDFFAAALRKAWAAGGTYTAGAGTGLTSDNSAKTLTRAGGSWITDGFKAGDVIRTATFDAAIDGKNLRIASLTATVLTLADAPGATVGTADESCTVTVVGKKLFVPTSAHTDDLFTFEHWFSNINQSERFDDCKVSQVDINVPPNGMATVASQILGRNIVTDTSEYFTSPTAETGTAVLAGANGTIRVGGTDIAVVTGFNITIAGGHSTEAVVGSNIAPDIFPGRVVVTGQMTAFFEDATLRDLFVNETESTVHLKLDADSTGTGDFFTIIMSRIKVGGSSKDDGEKGIVQTLPFNALINTAGGAATQHEQSTIVLQDSTL